MHRVSSILLLFFYLFTTTVTTITLHYCSGNLVSLNIFKNAYCCCDDNSNQSNDCCNNEVKVINIADDQLKIESEKNLILKYKKAINENYYFTINNFISLKNIKFYNVVIPDPPDNSNILATYSRIHSFLFYS